MGDAAQRWAGQLEAWAIPDHIMAQAPESPWAFTPALFSHGDDVDPDTPSRRRAVEALPAGGVVLDVGCGGGAASLPLAPPASLVIGFDQGEDLLAKFAAGASERGIAHQVVQGRWPDDAGKAGAADVVVSHHVLYNVADLAPFVAALTDHARNRVVVEIGSDHPRAHLNWLWPHFWGIERPSGPTADDAVAVLEEAGIRATVERSPGRARHIDRAHQVASVRRYLCLPAERDPEIEALLDDQPPRPGRETVTIWWDGSAPTG